MRLSRNSEKDSPPVPFDWACHHKGDEGRSKVRLSEVLASLDSGQDIVQVDSEDGTVRVWVE